MPEAGTVRIVLKGSDNSVTVLKEKLSLEA
jgi:hypothetical protein